MFEPIPFFIKSGSGPIAASSSRTRSSVAGHGAAWNIAQPASTAANNPAYTPPHPTLAATTMGFQRRGTL